jgi:hypothetical protein
MHADFMEGSPHGAIEGVDLEQLGVDPPRRSIELQFIDNHTYLILARECQLTWTLTITDGNRS